MNGKLNYHMLLAILLNSAWKHAQNTEFGFQTLSARNLIWVLSKLQLSFERMPNWGDEIVIETWGKRIEKLYALRDFLVSSTGGGKLCSATSAWLILDKISYRPQKLDHMMKDFPWQPERSLIETSLKKVPELMSAQPCIEFPVSFSDIDVNKHATATKYLQWMIDGCPIEVVTTKELKSAEICFLSEAVLGDRISICMEKKSEEEFCSIRRSKDKQELCRARMEWKNTAA
jgi:acyl-ACP thioesterase